MILIYFKVQIINYIFVSINLLSIFLNYDYSIVIILLSFISLISHDLIHLLYSFFILKFYNYYYLIMLNYHSAFLINQY
jgi:hypothetical protein